MILDSGWSFKLDARILHEGMIVDAKSCEFHDKTNVDTSEAGRRIETAIYQEPCNPLE